MTKDEAMDIMKNHEVGYLLENYSLYDLMEIYRTLYDTINPPIGMAVLDIIYRCKQVLWNEVK